MALLYDHQRHGVMLNQSVGFWFMSTKANLLNCYAEIGVSECWSRSTRDYMLDNLLGMHGPDENRYFDLLYTIKLCWMFPLKGKHYDGEWYTNKPDYDNLPKAMNDIMTKLGYWKDDCIIASGITEKFWSATPGIYVRIEELKPNIKKTGCHECVYADWDADGCTCKLDGLLVWNPRRGCECRAGKE